MSGRALRTSWTASVCQTAFSKVREQKWVVWVAPPLTLYWIFSQPAVEPAGVWLTKVQR